MFHTTHLFRDVSCLRMQFFGQRSLWFWWANCRKIKVFMFVPSSHCVWIFKINWSISYVKSRKGISKAVSVNRWWYDEKRKYVVVHSVTTRVARRNWTWKKISIIYLLLSRWFPFNLLSFLECPFLFSSQEANQNCRRRTNNGKLWHKSVDETRPIYKMQWIFNFHPSREVKDTNIFYRERR